MKRILLLFTIIALVWSCEKDDNNDKLTYEEVVYRLEIEKAKVNQDSLNAIVEGDWYGEFSAIGEIAPKIYTHLIFSSASQNFKDIRNESTDGEKCIFNVKDYFFVKVDPDPGVYRLVSFHNRFGGINPDRYAELKITKEEIVYIPNVFVEQQINNDVNLAYEYVMTKSVRPFSEEFGTKLQRKK